MVVDYARFPAVRIRRILLALLLVPLAVLLAGCQPSATNATLAPPSPSALAHSTPTELESPSRVVLSATPASGSACATVTALPTQTSSYLSNVVLAFDTRVGTRDPVNPTGAFSTVSTFHAVVQVTSAPPNTTFTATWYADDLGDPDCNIRLDSADFSTQGSGNIDFTLAPKSTWPVGSYHVEVAVNGVSARSVAFRVDNSIPTPTHTPTVLPPETATPSALLCGSIPPDKGGLVFKNYYGQEVLVDLAGQLYRVSPGGQSAPIVLDPHKYTFHAKINQVAEGTFDIEIVAGQCRTFTFSP